jgi:hypothetical protein
MSFLFSACSVERRSPTDLTARCEIAASIEHQRINNKVGDVNVASHGAFTVIRL